MAKIKNPLTIISTGGSVAYIVVTAPVGSLLTCGTQTYQLGAQETEHQFTVTVLGTYTVTATVEQQTATQTVLVDVFAAYMVQLHFNLILYDYGNEKTSVTGGWTTGWVYNSGYSQRKNEDNLYLHVPNGTATQSAVSWMTQNAIDVTLYTTLKVLASTNVLSNEGFGFSLYVGNPANVWNAISNTQNGATAYGQAHSYWPISYRTHFYIGTTDVATYIHDFSREGLNFINIADYGQNDWNIYKVWLE